MDPNKEVEKLEKKLSQSQSISEKWDIDDKLLDEEERRLRRMEEIQDQATKAYSDRCDAKLAEVGGADNLLKLIDSGQWDSSDDQTPIEIEYNRLRKEQFHCEWFREHDKPYDMKDDPNAKF